MGLGCAGKPCKLWDLGKSSSVSGKDLGSATFRVSLDRALPELNVLQELSSWVTFLSPVSGRVRRSLLRHHLLCEGQGGTFPLQQKVRNLLNSDSSVILPLSKAWRKFYPR